MVVHAVQPRREANAFPFGSPFEGVRALGSGKRSSRRGASSNWAGLASVADGAGAGLHGSPPRSVSPPCSRGRCARVGALRPGARSARRPHHPRNVVISRRATIPPVMADTAIAPADRERSGMRPPASARVLLLQVRDQPRAELHEQRCFLDRLGLEPERLQAINVVERPVPSVAEALAADVVILGGAGAHSAYVDYPFTE